MLLPEPPLNEHGRLAVNTADIAEHLEYGLTAGCTVCDHSAIHWWRMPTGEYIPVHAACARRLVNGWHERIESGDVGQPELGGGARRGAYARRATATGARVHPPRPRSAPSRSLGSPYFRPGMPKGAPWVIVIESTHGRLTFVHGDNESHARKVFNQDAALTERGLPLWPSGPMALGAALLDPTGAIVDGWGEEFDLDSPSPHKRPEPHRPVVADKPGKRKRASAKDKTYD
ncbi:hypothetical protein [Actinophytocola sp.]|uniref:hypothetical protein n=1 Tax=Actinophytocola sp. TaxID=1872138 RepID=UPI002D7EC703|nr:hypothetical protein [Actinophytocola sp.]HET9144078.1 hypothetical protein [Actinophytocola sp.]